MSHVSSANSNGTMMGHCAGIGRNLCIDLLGCGLMRTAGCVAEVVGVVAVDAGVRRGGAALAATGSCGADVACASPH